MISKSTKKKLQSNIWKYTLFVIANKRIFVAILGAYYLSIPGVTPKGIGIILLAGSLAGFIFEIPSGYVSDKMGHKKALVFSRICVLLSTTLFLFANNIILLILGAIFMSIGHAFHSGTGSAFIHETLRALSREKDYTSVMGKVSSIGFAVPIALMILIPFLVDISFKTPFIIGLFVDLIGLISALTLFAPPVSQEEIQEIRSTNFKKVMKEGHRLGFFPITLFTGIISGTLFAVGGFRAPYQTFLEIPVVYYGVFLGIGRIFASLMLAYSSKIKEKTNFYSFCGFKLALYFILILALSIVSSWLVVVFIFIIINAFQWGLGQVTGGYTMEIKKKSKFKATLSSVGSQIDQIVAAITAFSIGFIIEKTTYRTGFLWLAIIFFVLLLSLYFYILKNKKYKKIFG